MYSFQVARSFDGEKVRIDDYLTDAPMTSDEKQKLAGSDLVIRGTHWVPVVRFSDSYRHYTKRQLHEDMQAYTSSLVMAGMAK